MVRVKEQQQDNSLVISDVRADDSGLYTCMVKNSLGETQKVANLTVRKGKNTRTNRNVNKSLKFRNMYKYICKENKSFGKIQKSENLTVTEKESRRANIVQS